MARKRIRGRRRPRRRSRTTRRTRRRTASRPRAGRNSSNRMGRTVIMPSIMAPKVWVPFRICKEMLFTGVTAEFTAGHTLTPNNLLDPWGSDSAVIQPTGMDQWAAFFQRYRCTRVAWAAKFVSGIATEAQNRSTVFAVMINQNGNDITTGTKFANICNQQRVKWAWLPGNEDTARPQRVTLKGSFTPNSIFKNAQKRDFDTRVTEAVAPPLQPNMEIFVTATDDLALVNTTVYGTAMVTMTIYGYFHDRNLLSLSTI